MNVKNTDLPKLASESAYVHHGAEKLSSRVNNLYRAEDRYQASPQPTAPTYISQGQHLYGENYADPTQIESGQAVAANWSSYTGSRIMVRLFSRGLMGATLYTAAHRWVPGQLRGYKAVGAFDKSKPLQWLSRGFDIAYGKPIQAYVKQYYKFAGKSSEEITRCVEEATTFRRNREFGIGSDTSVGRSLGAEIVGMTTDFAAGSTGDAWGRNIANMFDPNFRNRWQREDGSIDLKEFGKSNARSAWKIFSKNQGEDWAVALPYVYQMKFQRVALNKIYRGFSLSSDHGLNGGSWRLNKNHDITGSYAGAGAIDLQARFTGYNIYTLMYRDIYDRVNDLIHNGFEDQSTPDEKATHIPVIDPIFRSARYVAKSAIKATIYMTPAVPLFWATRTPQTKAHGMGIVVDSANNNTYMREPVSISKTALSKDPFAVEHTRGVFDRATTPLGKACYKAAKGINKAARSLGIASHKATEMGFGHDFPKTFAEDWVNASASYTPYMIAKAETALRCDRPKGADGMNDMDKAIYRFLDGVSRLNLGEVKSGLMDIREEIVHPDSNREIQEKTKQKALEKGKEAPGTKVQEVTEQDAIAVTKPKNKDNSSEKPNSSWKNKHIQEQFMQNTTPDAGATIH